MKRAALFIVLLALAGCSNLSLKFSGTYTGDEVCNVEK